MPLITGRSTVFKTPWFDIVAKQTDGGDAPYYSLRMRDYVSVIAFTPRQEILLVRQYRPAVERYTLELPSGLEEEDETPEQTARRELEEETGYRSDGMELLGVLLPDTGRLANRLWCYFAAMVTPSNGCHNPEPGIEPVLIHRTALLDLIAKGEFNHALNLGVLALGLAKRGPELFGVG